MSPTTQSSNARSHLVSFVARWRSRISLALDGDSDQEPDLGAPEIGATITARTAAGDWFQLQGTQETWAKGIRDGRELDLDGEEDDALDHGEHDDSDRESSIGFDEPESDVGV